METLLMVGVFAFAVVTTGYFVFKKDMEYTTISGGILKDLTGLWDDLLSPIGRFFWRPFTDIYKVAVNHPEVLPARGAICWLAAISILMDFAIVAAVYHEKWRVLTVCAVIYIVVHLARSFIWSLVDFFLNREDYFG